MLRTKSIIPVEDRARLAKLTLMDFTVVNFVRGDVGDMVWSAPKQFMKEISTDLNVNFNF